MERGRDQDNLRELYRILGLVATREILLSILDGKNQYNDFLSFGSNATINGRLRQLINLGLIEHKLVRDDKRREYYTLTERGESVIEADRIMEKAFLD